MTGRDTRNLAAMLGFPYAAILVFSAFGPVLYRLQDTVTAALMSIVFLVVLAAAMLIPPGGMQLTVEKRPPYLPVIMAVDASIVAMFGILPLAAQWAALIVTGFVLGRTAVFWSRSFLGMVPKHLRGRVISYSLGVAYGLLYLFNAVSPALPSWLLPPLVGFLIITAVPAFHRLPRNKTFLLDRHVRPQYPLPLRRRIPFAALSIVFLLYIVAGFTFAGMLPELAVAPIDRYYNVLAFVVAVPFAGRVADRLGNSILLYSGVAAIGLAIVFFQLEPGITRYAGAQTAVQIGWACLDVYVFVWAAGAVFEYKNAQLQNVGVATFLIGTSVGAMVTLVYWDDLLANRQLFLLTIPLFVAILLMGGVVRREALPPPDTNMAFTKRLPSSLAALLTDREHEIALFLIGHLKNREICEKLYISPNTLKTHCRHIYRKLNVSNRLTLRDLTRITQAAEPSTTTAPPATGETTRGG